MKTKPIHMEHTDTTHRFSYRLKIPFLCLLFLGLVSLDLKPWLNIMQSKYTGG